VVKRGKLPWAATSMPDIRRQWCNALDAMVAQQSMVIDEPPPAPTATAARLMQQLTAKARKSLLRMRAEIDAIRSAELYWVSRDMVDVAVAAAETLPEWTPSLVVPAPNGLLCWAKPTGVLPFLGSDDLPQGDVTLDGMWWWTDPEGILQMQPVSRLAKNPKLANSFGGSSPLWTATSALMVDPRVPRDDELTSSPLASTVSVLGAAWLLMGQPLLASTRAMNDSMAAPASSGAGRLPHSSGRTRVTIVELRRPINKPRNDGPATSGRQFQRRWWVSGHWRQQVCGPSNSQRRPTWIEPYTKGPQDAPLINDRVHVWRR
jgi:hypothetical protein